MRVAVAVPILFLLAAGCSSDESNAAPGGVDAGNDGSANQGTGGRPVTGGASGVGGTSGGKSNSGGAPGAGGNAGGSGGSGSGGASSTGGAGSGSGGTLGSGGAGGSAGSIGDGGFTGSGGGSSASTSRSRHTQHPLGGAGTPPSGFYEYLPPGYDGSARAPLLLFFHGVGSNGNGSSDLNKVLTDGVPWHIENDKWPDARPFIVLSAQYVGLGGDIRAGSACPSSATIHAFLTWALAHYQVDPKRVFITGLSCGAIGTWDYLAEHQGSVVAASVLVAGNPLDPDVSGSTWARAGCTLGTTAVWSLHGDKDNVVPFAPDKATMERLIACPSPPRRSATFSALEGAGHGIWGPIYDLTSGHGDIYQWLLANAKP